MDTNKRFEELPEILTVDETAAFLRLSRSATYEAIRTRAIPSVRIGRRILVPRRGLTAFVQAQDPKENRDERLYRPTK